MGWASGSEMMDPIIRAAKKAIPELRKRKWFYEKILPAFEDQDWDTEHECLGIDPAFDAVMKKRGITVDAEDET